MTIHFTNTVCVTATFPDRRWNWLQQRATWTDTCTSTWRCAPWREAWTFRWRPAGDSSRRAEKGDNPPTQPHLSPCCISLIFSTCFYLAVILQHPPLLRTRTRERATSLPDLHLQPPTNHLWGNPDPLSAAADLHLIQLQHRGITTRSGYVPMWPPSRRCNLHHLQLQYHPRPQQNTQL